MPTVAETIKKVEEFVQLPNGWHYGEGVPPSEPIRQKAILVLRVARALGITRTNAFPGINGEIQITFYHQNSMLELDLELDGSVTIAEDIGRTQVAFDENASFGAALNKLREFSEKIWSTLESSIGSTTIQSAITSQAAHLIYPGANLFLLSKPIARFRRAATSVNILQPITEINQVTRPSIGRFPTGLFRRAVGSFSKEVPLGMIVTTISTAGQEEGHELFLSH